MVNYNAQRIALKSCQNSILQGKGSISNMAFKKLQKKLQKSSQKQYVVGMYSSSTLFSKYFRRNSP
jgi:hypothetical protein